MKAIDFKNDDNGFYVAHFRCSGVVTLHIEYETSKAVNTTLGISSFEGCKYKDDEVVMTNPVDGDWQIGDGNNTKYLEIRCPMIPSKGLIDGNVTEVE